MKKFIFILVFIFSFFSVYSVVLNPVTDITINFNDSSKGIWWSEFSIYAKTGISVGDIIELNYSFTNSSDYGLFPLLLKLKDTDTIICVNELLDNIAPYQNYNICFYNNDKFDSSKGFNYSVRESQNIFTTKNYDVVHGKSYYKSNINYMNYDFGVYESSNIKNYDGDIGFSVEYAITSNNLNNFKYEMSYIFRYSKSFSSSGSTDNQYIYSDIFLNHNNIVDYASFDVSGNIYQSGSKGSAHCYGYFGGMSLYGYETEGNSHSFSGSSSTTNLSTINLVTSHRGSSYSIFTCSITNSIILIDYHNNIKLKSVVPIPLCKDLTSSSDFYCDNNYLYVSETIDKQNNEFNLSYNRQNINKETDDTITELNIVPYATNSELPTFITIKDENNIILFYDLYDLDVNVKSQDISDSLSVGDNTLKLEQVNDEGGYFLFFEGSYNKKPVVQGTILTDKTTYYKNTYSTCTGGTYQDDDSDTLSDTQVKWFNVNTIISQTEIINLSDVSINKGAIIKCGKRYNDGTEWGEWVYSSGFTIQDSTPTLNINISPESPGLNDDVNCSYNNYLDLDNDIVQSYSLNWIHQNGTTIATSSTTPVILLNENILNSVIYTCKIIITQSVDTFNFTKQMSKSNVAPDLTNIITPSNTYSQKVFIENFLTASDINNDPLTYIIEFSNDLSQWTQVSSTNNNFLNWSVSSLDDGVYYIRAKVSDGNLATPYSSVVPINIINFDLSHNISFTNYLTTELIITTSSSSSNNQYSGGTDSLSCGEFNSKYRECYFYTPIKFDGSTGLEYIDITPYQFMTAGVLKSTGFTKDYYDLSIYELNSKSIPLISPIFQKKNIIFEMDKPNRIYLSNGGINYIPSADKYIILKLCINADSQGVCNIVDNAGDDSLYIYSKISNTGDNIAHQKDISSPEITFRDPNILISWEDKISNNINIEINNLFEDENLEPMLIQNENGENICVNDKISEYYPTLNKNCINSINDNFILTFDSLSKTSSNLFYITYGKEILFDTLEISDVILRPVIPSSDSNIIVYGSKSKNIYPSNILLKIGGNTIWSYPLTLNSRELIPDVKDKFNNLINPIVWSAGATGSGLIYHFEPFFVNFSVIVPSTLTPVNNGIAPLKINIHTNLEFSPALSYCTIKGNDVEVITRTFSKLADNIYLCEPALEFSVPGGSYKVEIHIEDSHGKFRDYETYFSYGIISGYTITSINFDDADFDDTLRESLQTNLLIQNTGNSIYNNFKLFSLESEEHAFWLDDDETYFKIKNRLGYASSKADVEVSRSRNKFNIDKFGNEIFNGELNPGQSFQNWWNLDLELPLESGDYTTRLDLEVVEVEQ